LLAVIAHILFEGSAGCPSACKARWPDFSRQFGGTGRLKSGLLGASRRRRACARPVADLWVVTAPDAAGCVPKWGQSLPTRQIDESGSGAELLGRIRNPPDQKETRPARRFHYPKSGEVVYNAMLPSMMAFNRIHKRRGA